MRIFVIHKGEDYNQVLLLKEKLEGICHVDILVLESDSKFKSWKSEAKYKIKICDLVLYVLGKNTYKSTNVDFEIKYSLRKRKQILLYALDAKENYEINKALFCKDKFTGKGKPLFKVIKLEDLTKILQYGYDFDINQTLDATNYVDMQTDLIEQYKVYLQTSEEVLNRRQNVSNFYTTLNTSLLTLSATIASILFGIKSLTNNYLLGCSIAVIISLIGIFLSFNWIKLLDSYGALNGAKIRVISEIEKKLPANIYDTEWKVMSEKLGSKNYISFTNIEKRVPKIFICIYCLLSLMAVIIAVFAIINTF